ncbi:MAG: HU family DNA-binding protein [Spirochaetes bacterium]|nr:HU family DNA-binding protein [Spirochaetota bacterium]
MAKESISNKVKQNSEKTTPGKNRVLLPESYTLNSMADYLAAVKEISKKEAKEILEIVINLIESGVLKGERVPLGKIGKIYAKVKPATKARKGRNPITGEEITIAAKKASIAPKFTFSKGFKDEVLKAKIKR